MNKKNLDNEQNISIRPEKYSRSISGQSQNKLTKFSYIRYRTVGCNNKSFVHCSWFVINWSLKRGTRRCGQVETFCLPCEWSLSLASPSQASRFVTVSCRNCLQIVRRQEVGNATSGRTLPDDYFKTLFSNCPRAPSMALRVEAKNIYICHIKDKLNFCKCYLPKKFHSTKIDNFRSNKFVFEKVPF